MLAKTATPSNLKSIKFNNKNMENKLYISIFVLVFLMTFLACEETLENTEQSRIPELETSNQNSISENKIATKEEKDIRKESLSIKQMEELYREEMEIQEFNRSLYENPHWELTQGILPSPDPIPLVYEGEVELRGFIVYQSAYVGDPVAHLQIIEEDLEKIPSFLNKFNFAIDDKTEIALVGSSEVSPKTITANRIFVKMEGSPTIRVSEVR